MTDRELEKRLRAIRKEVASPLNFDDIEFLYDWWEGEKFIKLYRKVNLSVKGTESGGK